VVCAITRRSNGHPKRRIFCAICCANFIAQKPRPFGRRLTWRYGHSIEIPIDEQRQENMRTPTFLFLAFGLCLFLYLPDSHATSLSVSWPDDKATIAKAESIVEGDVRHVREIRWTFFKYPCFDGIYELEVKTSFRGPYKAGDIVRVGYGPELPGVKVGDHQVAFLYKSRKNQYENCSFGYFGGVQNIGQIKTLMFKNMGVFTKLSGPSKDLFYRAVNCGPIYRSTLFKFSFHKSGFPARETVVDDRYCSTTDVPERIFLQQFNGAISKL